MVKDLDTLEPKLSNLLTLKNKVAVITGGAGWLGTSICETLVELGARIFIASRDLLKHQKVKERLSVLNSDADIGSVQLDLQDEESIKKCFSAVVAQAGRIDVLVNNAYSGQTGLFDEISTNAWKQTIDIGLTGCFLSLKHAAGHMQRGGGGAIVNVASMYGMVSPDCRLYQGTKFASSPAYGAAKAGVIQLTRYAACALAKDNVRVNSVSFGPFPSEETQTDQVFISRLADKVPLGRIGSPWEIKGALAFLSSDASSYVTGHNLVIDGGWTAW